MSSADTPSESAAPEAVSSASRKPSSPVHALAHPVGVCYGLPHGVVCGVLMPPVLALNLTAAGEKGDELRDALGGEPAEAFRRLLGRVGLPATLGAYPGADWERAILDYAVTSGSGKANPVSVDEAYCRGVLGMVCSP